MRAWVCARRWSGAAIAAVLLAGCENPDWMTRRDPLPDLPAWSAPLMGRPLAAAFTLAPKSACDGNAEQVERRYGGTRPGARISGWGWDAGGKAAVARVVVTGPDGVIAGAGESGRQRLDVPDARPGVTSQTTGWAALTTLSEGEALAFGVLADGVRVCELGRVAL